MNSSPFSFSPHRDLLDAPLPSDDAGKAGLIEECRNRGRAAVQAQAWPDAVALYRKALDCCDASSTAASAASSNSEQAILQSNLSLAAGKMNQWAEIALPAAQKATECDATYVKGWWRLGQAQGALQNYVEAVKALETAQKLEPNNQALKKELTKWTKKQQQSGGSTSTTTRNTTTTMTPAAPRTTATKKTTKKTAASTTNNTETIELQGTEFTKSDHVKGYKIVNGKKTSYFHNELSEEAKALIGDIQPTRLDNNTTATVDTTTTPKQEGTSAWNKAGTWEEKDCTQWAQESLQKMLQDTTTTTHSSSSVEGGGGGNVQTSVEKATVTGSASVAAVRGKRRFLYEFAIKVNWKLESDADEVTGRLEFPDVDGTCPVGEPYEASGFVLDQKTTALRSLCEKHVYRGGLREALHQTIDAWVALFQDTYGK